MFRIVESAAECGVIRLTVETDEPSTMLFMRFLRDAQAFAQAYAYRAKAAASGERRRIERAAQLPAMIAARARALALYRELPGSVREKIRALREIMAAQGDPVTVGGLEAELAIAREEERETRRQRILQLRREGLSHRKIGSVLGIPESTVRTLEKNARGCPRTDDRPPAAGTPLPSLPEPDGGQVPPRH